MSSANRYGYSVSSSNARSTYGTSTLRARNHAKASRNLNEVSMGEIVGVAFGATVAVVGGYFLYRWWSKPKSEPVAAAAAAPARGAGPVAAAPRRAAPSAAPRRPAPKAAPKAAIKAAPKAAAPAPKAAAAGATPAPATGASAEDQQLLSQADPKGGQLEQAEQAIIQVAMRSMDGMRQAGQDNTSPVGDREEQLLGMVRAMPIDSVSMDYRLLVSQWISTVHTLRPMLAASLEEYAVRRDDEKKDLAIAWKLLDHEFEASIGPIIDMLRVDIAKRMEDGDKLEGVFDRIIAKGELNLKEEISLFDAAAMIGRWADMRRLGESLQARPETANIMDEFHAASQRRPDTADTKVLFDLAEEEQKNGNTARADMHYGDREIVTAELRFREIDTNDDEMRERIENDFDGEWNPLEKAPGVKLTRRGAIGMMPSIGDVPIPLCGPCTNDSVVLRGFGEFRRNAGGTVRMQYTDRLARVDADTFEGEHVFEQLIREEDASKEPTRVRSLFDIRIRFKPE